MKSGKSVAAVNWIFNAWGEKYEELMADTRIACLINDDLKMECFLPGIVMEGGSIDVNGCGTVLTTEQCLLNRNRNPSLNKEEIETYLKEFLGVQKVIWLKEGIAGDDTDGHVDDIARFVNPTTVLCAYEDDPEDENFLPLKQNYELLCRETDQDGHPAEGDQAAHARARGRGAAAARQLRQLLYRERCGHGAGLRAQERQGGAEDHPGGLPGAEGRGHQLPGDGARAGDDPLHQPAAAD